MAGETFDITVNDRISKTITTKLAAIRTASTKAAASVRLLNVQLGRLGVTSTAVVAGGIRVAAVTTRTGRAFKTTATSVATLNTGFLPLIRNFRTIASIAAIIGATRGFVSSIDSFTELQNKLKNVTDSSEQLVKVKAKVAKVAREARVPIGDVGKAFQSFDIAVSNLGGSQE